MTNSTPPPGPPSSQPPPDKLLRIYTAIQEYWKNAKQPIYRVVMTLTYWFFFNVCIALTPLLITYLFLPTSQGSIEDFFQIFSVEGQLAILSVALVGGGIGDLLASNKTKKLSKLLAGGICTLCLIVACFLSSNTVQASQNSTVAAETVLPVVEESEDSETEASVEAIEQPFQEDTSGSQNIVSLTKRLFLISLGAAGACKILVALEDGTDEG